MGNLENQEYTQDGVQENMNKEFKILNELNDKQKEVTEKLDKPKKIADILSGIKNQISKITKKEDIQAYKDFLTTVQNNIKDKIPIGMMNYSSSDTKEKIEADEQYREIDTTIDAMLGSLNRKEGDLELSQKSPSVNTPIDTKKELEQHVNNVFDMVDRAKNYFATDTSIEGKALYNMFDMFNIKNLTLSGTAKQEMENRLLSCFDDIKGEKSITAFTQKMKDRAMSNNPNYNSTVQNDAFQSLINCLRIQDLSQRHDALKRLFTDDGIINNDLNTHRNNSDSNNIVPSINKIGGNINKLTTSLSNLTDTEIQSFKGIIDSLNNETILLNQIPVFSNMMNVLRQMKDVKKEDIMKAIDTYVDTKMQGKITPEQKDYLKKILGDVKEKGLINQFINQVDTSLEAQKRGGVDMLLTKITDKSTPDELLKDKEVNGSLNAIFHHNQSEYNKFVTAYDTADATQKPKLEKILQIYVKSEYPDIDFTGVTITREKITIKDKNDSTGQKKKEVQGFKFMKGDKILQGKDGKDITPFFGDADYGEAIPFDQTLKTTVGKNSISEEGLKLPGMKNFVNQIQEIAGKKMSISDAFKSLFDSPLFSELKKIFLMLGISMSKDKDTQKEMSLSLAVLNIQTQFSDGGKIEGKKIQDGKEVKDISKDYEWTSDKGLAKYLAEYNFNDDSNIKEKEIFVNCNSLQLQREYMMAKRVNDSKTASELFIQMKDGIKKADQKITPDKIKENEKPQEQSKPIELKDNKATVLELKINEQSQGLVEKKGEGDNQYLTIDGQVIPLINGKGSIFVKGDDGQIMEKIIIFDKKDNKENIAITDGEKLDMGLLETIKKTGNLSVLGNGKLDDNKLKLAKYYMFGKSIDGVNNPIDLLLEGINKLGLYQKKISELSLVKFQKEMLVLISGNISNTSEIIQPFNKITQELQSIQFSGNLQKKERNTVVEKRENNYHS